MSVNIANNKPPLMLWEEVQHNLEVLKILPEDEKLYIDGNRWFLDNRQAVSLKRGLHNWLGGYLPVGYGFDVPEVQRILGQMQAAIQQKRMEQATPEPIQTANMEENAWQELLAAADMGWKTLHATYQKTDTGKAEIIATLFRDYIGNTTLIQEPQSAISQVPENYAEKNALKASNDGSSLQMLTVFSGEAWKQDIKSSGRDVIQLIKDINSFCQQLYTQEMDKRLCEILQCCESALQALEAASKQQIGLEKLCDEKIIDVELKMKELEKKCVKICAKEKSMQEAVREINTFIAETDKQITEMADIDSNADEVHERMMQLQARKVELLAKQDTLVVPQLQISGKHEQIRNQQTLMKERYEESLKRLMTQNKEFYTLFEKGKESFRAALELYQLPLVAETQPV
jgi:hypothetical protein